MIHQMLFFFIAATAIGFWYVYFDPIIRALLSKAVPVEKIGEHVITPHVSDVMGVIVFTSYVCPCVCVCVCLTLPAKQTHIQTGILAGRSSVRLSNSS